MERDPRVLSVSDDEVVSDETMVEDDQVDTSASDGTLAETTDLERSRSKVIGRPVREQLRAPGHAHVAQAHRRHGRGPEARARASIAGASTRTSPSSTAASAATHPDVRPAGGKDCTHSGGWGDGYGHGLGVASILGARTTTGASWASCPASGCGRCASSTRRGHTKLSWVLCGLDWVANKRDRTASPPPLLRGRHAVLLHRRRQSKAGPGPGLRPADRSTSSTRRSAASRDRAPSWSPQPATTARPGRRSDDLPGIREVITVSAMADFDGKPGGKGRQSPACLAGIRARAGRPVHDLLLVRHGRRPHRARQVHLGRLPRQDRTPASRAPRSRRPWCLAPRC